MAYTSWSVVFGEQPSAAKWNILGTNDATFYDFISGTPGANDAWTTFTPAYTNLTVGNGTNTGKYSQVGRTVHVRTEFVLGGTSSVGSDPYITLPITAAAYTADRSQIGLVGFNDVGTNSPVGVVRMRSTTTASIFALNASSTYLLIAGVSSTAPFTWTTGDNFGLTMTYEAAS